MREPLTRAQSALSVSLSLRLTYSTGPQSPPSSINGFQGSGHGGDEADEIGLMKVWAEATSGTQRQLGGTRVEPWKHLHLVSHVTTEAETV